MKKNKKTFKKISSKFFCFVLLALFSLSTIFVSVSASGIEYGEEDTIFTFDLNRDYLTFIDDNFPNDFDYYFTLPVTFTIGNNSTMYNNLSVRIIDGSVSSIWFEGLSNMGFPIDIYLVESGVWNYNEVLTEVAFNEGIVITETIMNDLYSFNFQYNDNRDFDNYINRFYQYIAINNLLRIKLNTYRFKTDLPKVTKENDNILYNISMVYINQRNDTYKIIGYTIGGTLLDENENVLDVPIPKISFMSNNEKYNELEFGLDLDNGEFIEGKLSYNNVNVLNFDQSTEWLNNNYKFLTLYNDIGIMDYLNLSIYGDFNVSQFWFDLDEEATFNDLFTGIANIPITILSNLLSFSVFGWTAFAVLTGIITLLVIIWLIRKLTH